MKSTTLYSRIADRIKKLSTIQKIVIALILALLFAAFVFSPSDEITESEIDDIREVSLINVSDSSRAQSPLLVTGSVRSKAEASLRTEAAGEVTGVYVTPGSFVSAGTVIAEISNAGERASVAQAQAALDASLANLAKGTGGARIEEKEILEINVSKAESTLSNTISNARNTVVSIHASIDDTIRNKTDQLFSNPSSNNPIYNPNTSESSVKNKVVQSRTIISELLQRQQSVADSIYTDEVAIEDELTRTENELRIVLTYLDNILITLNNAIPTANISQTTISAYKTDVTSARSLINGALSSLTSTKDALSSAKAGLAIAEKNLEQGVTGAQSEDVSALEASVRQAEAGLAAARANLARKLIISPISGTLNSLNIRRGDFVNAFEQVAVVSNNNALEIETFITEQDKNEIRVGSTALIANVYDGVVTSISPGVDPITKKIQVRVGISDTNTSLTHGSSVRLFINRNGFKVAEQEIDRIIIPISALKVEANRYIVFSVDDRNQLNAIEVSPGLVLGDTIVIDEGLSTSQIIVADARGLREGQEIIIK